MEMIGPQELALLRPIPPKPDDPGCGCSGWTVARSESQVEWPGSSLSTKDRKTMERDTAIVTAAINQKRLLRIDYPPGARLVEPHALGWSAEANLLLRAYQTEGASASGEHEHWKLLRVDRAESIELADAQFTEPRPGYRRGDRAMKGGIIAEL